MHITTQFCRGWGGLAALIPVLCSLSCTGGTPSTDDGPDPKEIGESWIVGGWLSTDDAWTGYLTVVDDLSKAGQIDLSQAVVFEGDFVYDSPGDGVVFVGLGGEPRIERWEIVDGALQRTGDINFGTYGVTQTLGAGRNVIQFIDDTRTFYIDNENLQVIEWNREDLTITSTFSLDGLLEEGQEWGLNFVHQDGARLIVTARYWDLQEYTATQLVRAAFVDTTDNSVQYVDDTRCGNIGFQATDDAGNLYLASHQGQAIAEAAGFEGDDPTPICMLRINRGETAFDDGYFVELSEVAGGAVVGGLLQGSDDHAYVFHYTGEPVTVDNWRTALRGEDWSVYSVELGNEAASYAPVPGLEGSTSYGLAFQTQVEGVQTPFLVAVDAEFSAGNYYDMSKVTNAIEGLAFPGFPGHALYLE